MKLWRHNKISTARQQAANEVADLFARDMTPQQEKRLIDWKQASPQNATELDGAIDLWSQLENFADDPEITSWSDSKLQPKPRRYPLALAATVLLAIAVAMFNLYWSESQQKASDLKRYVTRIGEQKTVQLPDGSVVTMNTGSNLLVDFNDGRRRIVLDRGEAYFDVAKDSQRPFIVDLGAHAVTVLGTEFNIRKIRSQLNVAVVEGAVALHPASEVASTVVPAEKAQAARRPQQQHRLNAGDVLTIQDTANPRIAVLSDPNIHQITSWRSGKIYFHQQPLYKVIQEINRYTARKILIEDAAVMGLTVTAIFHVSDMDAILSGLEQSLPIQVKRYSDSIVIVGNGQ